MPPAVSIPLIDLSHLRHHRNSAAGGETEEESASSSSSSFTATARALGEAAAIGVFYVKGHGIAKKVMDDTFDACRRFFSLPEDIKRQIDVASGGTAWRGYAPLGCERGPKGKIDFNERLYFGPEHDMEHNEHWRGRVLHGRNRYLPEETCPGLRAAIDEYMHAMDGLGRTVLAGLSVALDLPPDALPTLAGEVPTMLPRIANYPPKEYFPLFVSQKKNKEKETNHHHPPEANDNELLDVSPDDVVGICPHTDYGFLVLSSTRDRGLQFRREDFIESAAAGGESKTVKKDDEWIEVPPYEASGRDRAADGVGKDELVFMVSIADLLDRISGGRFRSLEHRVVSPSIATMKKNAKGGDLLPVQQQQSDITNNVGRLAMLTFFDPNWESEVGRFADHIKKLDEEEEEAATSGSAKKSSLLMKRAMKTKDERWAKSSIKKLIGRWGDHLSKKLQAVFPDVLGSVVFDGTEPATRWNAVKEVKK